MFDEPDDLPDEESVEETSNVESAPKGQVIARVPLTGGEVLSNDLDELIEIVRGVEDPEQARSVLSLTMASMSMSWSGPLPHPAALAAYNDAYPDCAKEIVEMAKKQGDHRRGLESMVFASDQRLRQRGQYFGFTIAMVVILGGIFLSAIGKPATGLSALVIGVGSLVGLFIYDRNRQGNELEEKNDLLDHALEDVEEDV